MDLDFICLKNIVPLLEDGKAIFGYQLRDKSSVANAFMAAPPRHPLFENLIKSLQYNMRGDVLECTGPSFLTKNIKKYTGNDVKIYDMPILYTHEWNETSPEIETCNVSTEMCKKIYPDSYTSTVWTHTWWQ